MFNLLKELRACFKIADSREALKRMNRKASDYFDVVLSGIDRKTEEITNEEFENRTFSGRNHFIGTDEKRRNNAIIHIEFPYTVGNYAMYYKGSHLILSTSCKAIEILNLPGIPEKLKEICYFVLVRNIHVVHHMDTDTSNSKLAGINSISTSCCDNTYCLERMKQGDSICKHCYAETQQTRQLALQDRNTINGIILRNVSIPAKMWKKFFRKEDITNFFRFESFGDVQNKIQAVNYINIAKAFPKIHFAVWTKNKGIWTLAFLEVGKPENLSYVVSSNKVNFPETYHLQDKNVDHIFTVYSKEYIAANKVKINCGGRKCMEDCILKGKGCYFTNTEKEMKEELK